MKRLLLSSFLLSVALFYFDASFAQESAPLGADRHGVKNVTCKECHGEKNEITAPDINQCSKCHAPDEIEKKHAAPENYCAQCHSFDFKVK